MLAICNFNITNTRTRELGCEELGCEKKKKVPAKCVLKSQLVRRPSPNTHPPTWPFCPPCPLPQPPCASHPWPPPPPLRWAVPLSCFPTLAVFQHARQTPQTACAPSHRQLAVWAHHPGWTLCQGWQRISSPWVHSLAPHTHPCPWVVTVMVMVMMGVCGRGVYVVVVGWMWWGGCGDGGWMW